MPSPDNGEPITIRPPTTIQQTARERLKEAIRTGGIRWHMEHDPDWRRRPWYDGIKVDLDEDDVLDAIADAVIAHDDPEKDPDART